MDEVLQLQPMIADWKKDYNFELLIISYDREEDLHEFLREKQVDAQVLLDSEGEVSRQYEVQYIPADYLINQKGEIEQSFVGWDSRSGVKNIEAWLKNQ